MVVVEQQGGTIRGRFDSDPQSVVEAVREVASCLSDHGEARQDGRLEPALYDLFMHTAVNGNRMDPACTIGFTMEGSVDSGWTITETDESLDCGGGNGLHPWTYRIVCRSFRKLEFRGNGRELIARLPPDGHQS